ncbi:hypothetical protein MVEN_02173300 [Mycena venus]|uniref:Yeast cell wall synthesis Kre9/Knh1-like N-terminal domain-containing protein n=1 Tax=Mycena venus TaxID=2733690 RepID=A0A8H7CHK8_9AGAR|nr:hypothetical protein MVEN_02173300 [Mycena venus]
MPGPANLGNTHATLLLLVALKWSVGFILIDVVGTFQSGDTMTLQWVHNNNADPPEFDLELCNSALKSVNLIAKNVNGTLNKFTFDLPSVPPSDDYQLCLVDYSFPEGSVYATSNAFTVVAANQNKSSTSSNVARTSPAEQSSTTAGSSSTVNSGTKPGSASQSNSSSLRPTASSVSGPSSPTPPPISSSSNPATQPSQTHSAAVDSRKSRSGGSMAGITTGAVIILVLGILIWLRVRSRKKALPILQPQEYTLTDGVTPLQSRGEKSKALAVESRRGSTAEQLPAPQEQPSAPDGGGRAPGGGDLDLEQALQQNEALRVRIRMLENGGRLDIQLGSEWSYESPPGYMD